MRTLFILFFLITSQSTLWSQQKNWVFFTDKITVNSDFDTPISKTYTDSLTSLNSEIISHSKWLNAVVIENGDLEQLKKLSFVKHIQQVAPAQKITAVANRPTIEAIDFYLNQMSGWDLVNRRLTGYGVKIGVIDAGFAQLKEHRELKHLFRENQIIAFRDFIDTLNVGVTDSTMGNAHHGQQVLSKITGYKEDSKDLVGFATGATFYLARTENSKKEHQIEEYDWVRALEWMDSLGVKLVNSSLGYSKFDDETENYTKKQMNGKFGITSRAAEIAVKEKGMFLVISAGNSGNKDWELITVPADAPSVLTVGATKKEGAIKIGYSSIGPAYNDYLKPDVAVYSPNGTSFSAPAVTGYVACLMEYAPHLSNLELLEVVRKSCSLYPYGNNYIGYGVPNASKALHIIDVGVSKSRFTYEKRHKGKKIKIHFKTTPVRDIAIFEKKDKWTVGDQYLINPHASAEVLAKRHLKIKRKKRSHHFKTPTQKMGEIHYYPKRKRSD